LGLSKLTSKHWVSSKVMLAAEPLQGWPPATATPVMVTTSVSGDGWATSILPPPVWLKPLRLGVTCPWRACRISDAGGDAGAAGVWARANGAARTRASTPAKNLVRNMVALLSLAEQTFPEPLPA